MLYIADVIQDQAGVAMQLGQFLWQAQIAFGGQQTLHKLRCRSPQDRVPMSYQVMSHRSEDVTFSHTRWTHGDHISSILDKLSGAQALDLCANRHRETIQLEGGKRFLARQTGLCLQTFNTLLAASLTLQSRQFVEKGFMRESLFCG